MSWQAEQWQRVRWTRQRRTRAERGNRLVVHLLACGWEFLMKAVHTGCNSVICTCPVSSAVEQSNLIRPIGVQFTGGAQVVRVEGLYPHPAADRLDVLQLSNGIEVVTGKHYALAQLGVYVRPDVLIPGWLAEDLWMVKKGDEWVRVEDRVMRGIPSPGLFIGARWQNDRKSEWRDWPLWKKRWAVGDDVTAYLGLAYYEELHSKNGGGLDTWHFKSQQPFGSARR